MVFDLPRGTGCGSVRLRFPFGCFSMSLLSKEHVSLWRLRSPFSSLGMQVLCFLGRVRVLVGTGRARTRGWERGDHCWGGCPTQPQARPSLSLPRRC